MEKQHMDELDVVDVEEYSKAGKPVPRAKQYRIRIDKQQFLVDSLSLTGRQLLVLAGKQPPENYEIRQKVRSGELKKIGLDEAARFDAPGVERYVTLPLDQTEG